MSSHHHGLTAAGPAPSGREYVDAVVYMNRTGCTWRMLPHDFALTWTAAYKHFLRWARNGTWDCIVVNDPRQQARSSSQPNPEPSAGVVDSCSIKASAVRGPRGFDGAKKINGIKRHIIVDTLGLLLAVYITAANVQDRTAVVDLLSRARQRCPRLTHIWADRGYTGAVVATMLAALRFTIEIVSGIKPKGEFVVQKRRWVLERTFSWMHRCRRLCQQYEQTPHAHEAMTTISMISLMLRRLDHLTEPPS